jgi:non-heme chloroperoxidase
MNFDLVQKTVKLSTGVTLPYVEQGDLAGVPVIFLHGFLDSWHSFEGVLPHLPKSIRAFALTQRGHGDASRPRKGYSIANFAEDLKAFMDALELETAVIVGHSMGSGVTLRFAIDYPEKTKGLILIGASSTIGSSQTAKQYWDSTLAKLSDPVDLALVRQMIESALVQPVPERLLETFVQEGKKVPAFVWRELFERRWREEGDFSRELGQIKVPTLLVWGDRDARYPYSEQEALAGEIEDSRLIVYSGAGHMLHWEKPERLAGDIVRFIENITI